MRTHERVGCACASGPSQLMYVLAQISISVNIHEASTSGAHPLEPLPLTCLLFWMQRHASRWHNTPDNTVRPR